MLLCFLGWTNRDRAHCFVQCVSPNVLTGSLFMCIWKPFVFCARSRPTNKGSREQKPITKKLAEFHNQFVLLTMFGASVTASFYWKKRKTCNETPHVVTTTTTTTTTFILFLYETVYSIWFHPQIGRPNRGGESNKKNYNFKSIWTEKWIQKVTNVLPHNQYWVFICYFPFTKTSWKYTLFC